MENGDAIVWKNNLQLCGKSSCKKQGFGSLNVGHNHPKLLEALKEIETYPKIMQTAVQHLSAALAENLASITPGNLSRTFFCNSGAEAVEGALKLARIITKRPRFIHCQGAFHGKTLGALSVMGREKYRQPFEPLIPSTASIPYGSLESLEEELSKKDVAAFIVEPVQGEAGVIIPPEGFLNKARSICNKYGTLLIVDEVQTGFGRTGKMFACQWENVVPDIICLAKALGGGIVSSGAYVTTDENWKKAYGSLDNYLLHSSTFGGYWGNAIACAMGLKTIEIIIEENLAEEARLKGEYFLNKLNQIKDKHSIVKDVRAIGLLVGIEVIDTQTKAGLLNKLSFGALDNLSKEYLGTLLSVELINKYRVATVYSLNNPNVIRLEPPLTVTYQQLDYVANAIDETLSKSKNFYALIGKNLNNILKKPF